MLEQISRLAREAGEAIMVVYQDDKPLNVEHKSDDSPVTAADLAAHQVIRDGLAKLTPEIPLLSEEIRHRGRSASIGSAIGWWIR